MMDGNYTPEKTIPWRWMENLPNFLKEILEIVVVFPLLC